jgi:hypothetical protein
LEQSFTNAPIEPNFLVNGLSRLLEFLGVAAFGTVEKSSDHPIMEIESLVDEGCLGLQ